MAGGPRETIQRDLERVFDEGTVAGLADGQLLGRFVSRGDGRAFEALVTRHGPMVLGVCRRMLGDPHDVADAFQATFLVLVRKAGAVRDADQLGAWLHGVAARVAARARSEGARRCDREKHGARAEAVEHATVLDHAELRGILDEEVDRLPEKYRRPVILCYLEGQTHEEAARRLRCTPGMLRGRLDRARVKLRSRLTRRGLAPAAALGACTRAAETRAAVVPAALKETTVAVAGQALAGRAAATAVSASVMTLVAGVVRTLIFSKLKLALSVLIVGVVLMAVLTRAITPAENPGQVPVPAQRPAASAGPKKAEELEPAGSGITVTGHVLDRQGRPIAGARVGQGSNRQEGLTPETTSDAQGRFVFRDVKPGPLILTVQASRYAPELKSVGARAGLEPIEFRLGPGRLISGRIVDLADQPIAGAPVSAGYWRKHQSLLWHTTTDADGRYRWDDAPEDEVLIDIGTLGYTSKRYVAMDPARTDREIKMPRPRFVRGSVTDAETGRPIAKFTMLPGHAGDAGENPQWEFDHPLPGSGGFYEVKLGAEFRDFVRFVRVEADGYLSEKSRAFKQDESEWDHQFDFKLRRGDGSIGGVVHRPDGLPLAGATVMVLTARSPIIVGGQPPGSQFGRVLQTGTDGRFRFPAPERPFTVVVLHDRGFAERTWEQLAGASELTIEPWGRIEGTYRIGARPAAGKTLNLTTIEGGGPGAKTHYGGRTTTDAAGHFAFERVHPGDVAVARPVKQGHITSVYPLSEPVKVAPGATTTVTIGGTGRPVIGRVRLPATLAGQVGWEYSDIHLLADQAQHRAYIGDFGPDGSFRVDDVPAGHYQLAIEARKAPSDPNAYRLGDPPLGSVRRDFTIPAMPAGRSDEPLDLGEIEIEPAGRP